MTEHSKPPPPDETLDAVTALRALEIEHTAEIRALHDASIKSAVGPFLTETEMDAYRAFIQSPAYSDGLVAAIRDQRLIGAFVGGFLAGTVGWQHTLRVDETACVRWLFVHPLFSDRGIGRRLLSDVELRAVHSGCRRMTAQVTRAALPFFEHFGYTVSSQGTMPVASGVSIPVAHLRRPLMHVGIRNLTRH
ncbi:MAG: GNAT family N-acetyltransferase [Pseudomonadota bacterium]